MPMFEKFGVKAYKEEGKKNGHRPEIAVSERYYQESRIILHLSYFKIGQSEDRGQFQV